MHEQAKIAEAKYFLSQMIASVNDRPAFNFNLSAFLSAARSALQYALKESQTKTGGQGWYDGAVAGQAAVKFLKDKRNVSIHTDPVSPPATIEVSVTDTLHLSDSVTATIEHADGTTEELSVGDQTSPKAPTDVETTVKYQYFFKDWTGVDDVIILSQSYISQIESIVSNGVANGFLST